MIPELEEEVVFGDVDGDGSNFESFNTETSKEELVLCCLSNLLLCCTLVLLMFDAMESIR